MAHVFMGDHLVSSIDWTKHRRRTPEPRRSTLLSSFLSMDRRWYYLLREDFPAATAAAAELTRTPEPSGKWAGAMHGAVIELQQGKSRQALAFSPAQQRNTGGMECGSGSRRKSRPIRCCRWAGRQRRGPLPSGRSRRPPAISKSDRPLSVLAQVEAALGKRKESDAAMARLAGLVDPGESAPYTRVVAFTRGTRALIDGDVASAVSELTTAQTALAETGPVRADPKPAPSGVVCARSRADRRRQGP